MTWLNDTNPIVNQDYSVDYTEKLTYNKKTVTITTLLYVKNIHRDARNLYVSVTLFHVFYHENFTKFTAELKVFLSRDTRDTKSIGEQPRHVDDMNGRLDVTNQWKVRASNGRVRTSLLNSHRGDRICI